VLKNTFFFRYARRKEDGGIRKLARELEKNAAIREVEVRIGAL